MRVTYWRHSGFSVELGDLTLLFDYIGGGFQKPAGSTIAFISHEHGDHVSEAVYALADEVVRGMAEGEARTVLGAQVTAYGSTDEGVSFLVRAGGKSVFHAGDLNYWHWRHESTPAEIADARRGYERVLHTLAGEQIDLAFFPVDPRMGAGHAEGAEMFLKQIAPNVLIPMHFWDQPSAALDFAKAHPNVRALTRPGEAIEL
jgi:L-ascorbate metabolism protein UlaG (beta-lactamase superfamily)